MTKRRPTEVYAINAISEFLAEIFDGIVPPFSLIEDGSEDSAKGKCGWAFWVLADDSTSYVHEDLSIEWYGTDWFDGCDEDMTND
ncbi:hypothetical protein RPD76_07760 [Methylomonas sp. MV1]|uniref:hypothetical protein n=1 Tax=Methylomonas sp. MV1 TaxID=3073620 RepID=UPI0028A57F1B|nr:hypothetical protein [Methylomonas sp. MV1]MDT4329802.1 hypothetical protein [Methylomonas sp. MV1]